MTNEDIIKLAMKYGFTGGFDAQGNLTHDATFVEAVTEAVSVTRKETLEEMIYAHPTTAIKKAVAYEREACATVCDDLYRVWTLTDEDDIDPPDALDCKRAIRARGEA
jgi:hypothetical protein